MEEILGAGILADVHGSICEDEGPGGRFTTTRGCLLDLCETRVMTVY